MCADCLSTQAHGMTISISFCQVALSVELKYVLSRLEKLLAAERAFDTVVWQLLASVICPGYTIHTVVALAHAALLPLEVSSVLSLSLLVPDMVTLCIVIAHMGLHALSQLTGVVHMAATSRRARWSQSPRYSSESARRPAHATG